MAYSVYTTTYQSPLGEMIISGTEQYITVVQFANVVPPPSVSPTVPPLLLQCVEELIAYFNGKSRVFTVPVHQKGTAFQSRVWNQLLGLPYGKTISYLALARQLGDPKCIRAAAASNGKNNICIIVPCHRVVGANGSLVGYVGGLPRKKWLLQHELSIAHGVQTLF